MNTYVFPDLSVRKKKILELEVEAHEGFSYGNDVVNVETARLWLKIWRI